MGRIQTPVTCSYRDIRDISVREIVRMHEIFVRYYDNADLATFLRDMSKKTGAFIVRAGTGESARIVGFSTVTHLDLEVGGRQARGIFSGDTIIEREYWGTRSLQRAFLAYILRQRLANPFRPLYWFLISKGYKTYLLLANNYPRYYPNPDGAHPHLARVVSTYCRHLFPDAFDEPAMLLDFGDDYQKLKGDVAGITDEMRRRYPRIAFFETCNPSWERGTELPCVGEIAFSDLFAYFGASWRKLFSRRALAPRVQYE